MKSVAAAHLAHDPVLLPHQHLPEDIERLFPEAIADPPRRGEEDLDPIEELQDPVPALQRERALGASSGNQKARRKLRHRRPESSTSGAINTSDCAGKH